MSARENKKTTNLVRNLREVKTDRKVEEVIDLKPWHVEPDDY